MVHATVERLEEFSLQPFLSVSVGMIAGLTPACVTLPPNESFMLIPKRLSKPLSPTGTPSCLPCSRSAGPAWFFQSPPTR